MRAFLTIVLLLAAACSEAPAPTATATAGEATVGAVLVGADEGGDLGRRAALLPAAARVFRGGHRGVDALADMLGRSGAVAVVDTRAIAAELLDGATPRLEEQVPVARLASAPLVIAVAPRSPITDAAALKKKLTEDPSSLRFAGAEIGSIEHEVAALLVRDAENGASALVYAAYGSVQDAATGVSSGQSDVLVARYADVKATLASGTLRALGVATDARVPGVDLPTLREATIDVSAPDWALLVAPASISASRLAELRGIVDRTRNSSQWAEAVRANGWIDDATTQGMTTFLGAQFSRATSLYSQLGLRR
ncbi:MAG TPA: tripartite tricarboxylate transporter substrate-binding protein [Candidatus Dormibacteraeota bacterium]|nr:tripartite tricarboxylate transporter substrate-binding protein [Candidatus Dormibacteraeota bacterium]